MMKSIEGISNLLWAVRGLLQKDIVILLDYLVLSGYDISLQKILYVNDIYHRLIYLHIRGS